MEDITGPQIVEVEISQDGRTMWVNIDGECAFRVCTIGNVSVIDHRFRPVVPLSDQLSSME
jgi:hypothetical protein